MSKSLAGCPKDVNMTQSQRIDPEHGRHHSTTISSTRHPAPSSRPNGTDDVVSPRRPLRIGMVSTEFLGPIRNGGIGTAYTKLGEALNEAGHEITFLYTNGRYTLTESIEHWIEFYRRRGIRLVPLPESPVKFASISPYLHGSYRVYLWLRDHDEFDIIHFQECGGVGYHSVLARHQGLMLKETITVVGLHGSTRWVRNASERLASSGRDLEDDFAERRSAELSDVVWSPGRYMLNWVAQQGWDLRNRRHVQPYVVPLPQGRSPGHLGTPPIRELVFFGRQEVRKGLFVFLDAIDRLALTSDVRHFDGLVVTILGRATTINGEESGRIIRARGQHWPFRTQILADRDHEQALAYLQGEGRLAVIPSLDENYPNTVLECIALGVPFLASRVGSIPEQIHSADIERVCFDPEPRSLSRRLQDVRRDGHAPARLSFDSEANTREWVRWHEQLVEEGFEVVARDQPRSIRSDLAGATVSVCIAHSDRPQLLRQALDSILVQDEPPLEVIVVDAGSPGGTGQGELDAIARDHDFPGRGWRLIRQENRSRGAARNRAATESRGEYLLFLDDHNAAQPQAIATFTRVARLTAADALSCSIDLFVGEDPPGPRTVPELRWLASGANHPLSGLSSAFDGANTMIRRSAFIELGGFPEECAVDHQEWELLTRLMLKGYRLEIVPEALFWYRGSPGHPIPSPAAQRDCLRPDRPHFERIPMPYHPLVELCVGRSLPGPGWLWNGEPSLGPPAPARPLRYRLADGLNERLKRFPYMHRAGRTTIRGLLAVRRRVLLAGSIRTGGDSPGPA
jgi:glycosyltransferase involved in cell wall biosynthesis